MNDILQQMSSSLWPSLRPLIGDMNIQSGWQDFELSNIPTAIESCQQIENIVNKKNEIIHQK
jgi:hypothetical protein